MEDAIEDATVPKASVRSVPHVVEALTTVPWAITDEAMRTIVAIASRENEATPEALEAYRAKRVANTNRLEIRNGVGIIRAQGPMFRYSDMFSAISGATNYQDLAEDAQAAADNPDVRAILGFWDTPGGEVNGCAELADLFRAIAGRKPFESYVGGQCCSAGYWLASATSKITIASTAVLGSLGVLMGIRDSSERDAKSGVKKIEFVSSNAPNKRMDWSTDEGKARIQRTADQLEAVFLSDVAAYRGRDIEDVISNFGKGGVEVGQDAVNAGLADAIGSFEATLSKLSVGNGRTLSGTTSTTRSIAMKTFTQAEHDEAIAAAVATATTQANATAATAANARVAAILDSPAGKVRPTQARHLAFKTTMSAEEATGLMEASAEEIQTKPTKTDAEIKAESEAAAAAAAAAAKPTTTGQRSQDAVGGLALGTLTDDTSTGREAPKPAAINTSAIYAKRREAMAG